MSDTIAIIERLKLRQEAEAERITSDARAIAIKAITKTTIAASKSALMRVIKNEGRGSLAEPAADLTAIRNDPALTTTMAVDLRQAEIQARMLITGALALGYRSQVEGTPLKGAKLTVIFDENTRADINNYPILGENSSEHAEVLIFTLRHALLRTIAAPLTGQESASKLTEALGLVAQEHAQRVANLCRESYFAGTQAGLLAAARVLAKGAA